MNEAKQREIAEGALHRIAAMNSARDDDFQDKAMGELLMAFDTFRPPEHERQPGIEPEPPAFEHDLPEPGANELLDALREIARELDASPEAVAERCGRALDLIREVPSGAQ